MDSLKARKEEIRKEYTKLAERRQQDLTEMVKLEGANREIDALIEAKNKDKKKDKKDE